MEGIESSLSMYPAKCVTCKKYKGTLTALTSLIQEQNKTIEQLQRQQQYQDKLYQEQNRILKRTQELLLCCNCLWYSLQHQDFELCQECSILLPQ